MAKRPLVSRREQAQVLSLAEGQPKSTRALQTLIETVRSRAIDAVMADSRVRERVAGVRFQVVGADLRVEKPAENGRPQEQLADVGVYDYDHDVLLVASVDLGAAAVLGVEERSGIQPPPTDAEVDEAKELVLANEQFASLRRQAGLQVVALPGRASSMPEHRLYRHRVFLLTFWTGGEQPTKVGDAAVDLSARAVVPVAEADPLSSDQGVASSTTRSRRRR